MERIHGTLKEQLLQLLEMSSDAVVYARKPWSESSESILVHLTDEEETPTEELKKEGFSYVLGTGTAQEVIEVFKRGNATRDDRWRLLLHYAQFDAFPDWAYQL